VIDFSKLAEGVVFEDEGHRYSRNGITMQSVTQIIKPISTMIYGGIDDYVLSVAAERGTKVHDAIELHRKYEWETDDEEIKNYLDAYKQYVQDYKPESLATEATISHDGFNYAGRIDAINKCEEGIEIVDYKTTAIAHVPLFILQLCGYWLAFESKGIIPTKATIVQLQKTAEYNVFTFDATDIKKARTDFMSCLQLSTYKERWKI
jgi:hypothetical protein